MEKVKQCRANSTEDSEAFIKRLSDSDDYLDKYNYEGYTTEIEYESYDI